MTVSLAKARRFPKQAVMLAAGNGVRLQPLTVTHPKPLTRILGKTILEHNLEQLRELVKEVIIVVSYKREAIKKLLGTNYKGLRLRYVSQAVPSGTGIAAHKALPFLKDRFLILNGDDLYNKADIQKCLSHFPCILVAPVENPKAFGVVVVKNGIVKSLEEKPAKPMSNLVNTGLYFFDKSIFNYSIQKSRRGEYEFTDYLKYFIQQKKLYFSQAKQWIPISFSWNILDATEYFLSKLKKSKIEGKVEKNCHIKGNVLIGKNSLVKSGAYLEGPLRIGENCQIGPNCYLRKFTDVEDNCRIGEAVEIKNSVIFKNTNISHLSYVGDSIIGEDCNLGAGTIIANVRHDGEEIKVMIKNSLVNTGRKKFGAILGDKVKTGIGTLIYPGRCIFPDNYTLPGQQVLKSIS